jgi:hypothetical protein
MSAGVSKQPTLQRFEYFGRSALAAEHGPLHVALVVLGGVLAGEVAGPGDLLLGAAERPAGDNLPDARSSRRMTGTSAGAHSRQPSGYREARATARLSSALPIRERPGMSSFCAFS